MTTIDAGGLRDMIAAIARRVADERQALDRLDAALGDGDHGSAISRALALAADEVAALAEPTVGDIWLTTAKAVMNRMGGASGAVFGTFFLKGVAHMRATDALSKPDIEAALAAGLDGVKARGQARVGDKTVVDALEPAVAAFAAAEDFDHAWQRAADAARRGAASTKDLIARQGRAKFLGERAVGHIDPGAMTIALMFEATAKWWEGRDK